MADNVLWEWKVLLAGDKKGVKCTVGTDSPVKPANDERIKPANDGKRENGE